MAASVISSVDELISVFDDQCNIKVDIKHFPYYIDWKLEPKTQDKDCDLSKLIKKWNFKINLTVYGYVRNLNLFTKYQKQAIIPRDIMNTITSFCPTFEWISHAFLFYPQQDHKVTEITKRPKQNVIMPPQNITIPTQWKLISMDDEKVSFFDHNKPNYNDNPKEKIHFGMEKHGEFIFSLIKYNKSELLKNISKICIYGIGDENDLMVLGHVLSNFVHLVKDKPDEIHYLVKHGIINLFRQIMKCQSDKLALLRCLKSINIILSHSSKTKGASYDYITKTGNCGTLEIIDILASGIDDTDQLYMESYEILCKYFPDDP